MASQVKKAWADLSSDLSSLSDGWPPGKKSVLAGLPTSSVNRDTLDGTIATKQTKEDISRTEPSAVPYPKEASASFYRKQVTFEPSTSQPDGASASSIPEKRKRHLGPIDLSGATHPSGLADIRVPEPFWRGRQPPGIQIPKQLVDFGKYNMRYEAQRDLEPDGSFDRELPDGEQSWVANHYFDHLMMAEKIGGLDEGGNGSSLYPVRPPSPPLPRDVLENLQMRTLGMVEALTQARAERDGLLKWETELIVEEEALTERLKDLDEETKTLTREADRLREDCAERGIDVGHFDLFGDVASDEGSDISFEDEVSSLELDPSFRHSEMDGIVYGDVTSTQRTAHGSQFVADVAAVVGEEQHEGNVDLLRGDLESINLRGAA